MLDQFARIVSTPIRGARLAFLALTLLAGVTNVSAQVVYTYDNTTTGNIPESAACPTPLERTFVVTDAFTVGNIALGVDITHADRGQVRIQVVAPDNTVFTATPGTGGDANDNYRMMLSTNTEGALNDGDTDPVANSAYRRLVAVAGMNFYTGTSAGTWRVRLCDLDTAGAVGTVSRLRLVLRDTAGSAPSACGSNLTYNWGDNGALAPFVSFSTGGVSLTQTATSGEAPTDVAPDPSFITRITTNGNHTGYYSLHFDTSGDPELSAESVTFTFSEAATWLTFSLLDVDLQPTAGSAWEDYIRVEGFDDGGNPVPKQMTLVGAQLAFAGDWVESDSSVATTSTDGNVSLSFARPVRSLRVEYAAGDQPNDGSQVFQVIGLSDFQFCAFDYGDAPNTYNVTIAGGTVTRNTMGQRTLFMGTAPDGETDGSPGALANGDGADEDGITFPTLISAPPAVQRWQCGAYLTAVGEYCVSVAATNNTAADAQLVGWVDFNADGDFNDANERSLPALAIGTGGAVDGTFATGNVALGTTGSRILRWTGVTNATSAQTYIRLRLSSDASFFTASPAPNGQLTGGETEDHRIPATTLATRLNWVESKLDEGRLAIGFTSATETGNVGYSIHEKQGDQYTRLTPQLIPSVSVNTTDVSQYKVELARAPASGEFYIADHDVAGRTTLRGPFAVGQFYGYKASTKAVDWPAVRAAVSQDAASHATSGGVQGAKLWVGAPGFYRVTAGELQSQGLNLNGVPVDQIAVSFRGTGVPRRVHPATGVFGAGSYVDFFAAPGYSLYTAELPYLLKSDGVGVVKIASETRPVAELRDAWYWATETYSPEVIYNFASPTADPWHAARMLGLPSTPATASFDLQPSAVAASEFAAQLQTDLIGVTDWSGAGPDHHVRILVDGNEVGQALFDGVRAHTATTLLPQLVSGTANIQVQVPGDTGFDYDLVYLDQVKLRYPRLPLADASGRLFLEQLNTDTSSGAIVNADDEGTASFAAGFEGSDVYPGFLATGLNSGALVVYGGRDGEWIELASVTATGGAAQVPLLQGADSYWVSSVAAMGDARVEALPFDSAITGGSADYLIISHSLFIDDLDDIVALQQSRGLTTKVVDVAQIYQQFGHALPEADAIRAYLQQVSGPMGVDYVLLVGADTYDYKNYLGTGSVSFVPTVYSRVGDIAYAPTDSAYADINGDDVPDFAIGRLPVRNLAELGVMSSKIVAVQGSAAQRSLLLVAGGTDGESDFSAISDGFAALLPGSWQSTEAYVDDIGIGPASALVLDELSAGASLVSYVGHSAPIQWSTADQTVLTSTQVGALSGGVSDLVVQWGCWNSYFVSPNADTMAHAFLLAPGKGAAGVIGVSALTGADAHQALGNALYPFLAPGSRVGDALRSAKTALAGQRGLHHDILLSSTLLGDPAMPIR
jgi:Peptidase family C25/GEVED domain